MYNYIVHIQGKSLLTKVFIYNILYVYMISQLLDFVVVNKHLNK